MKENYFMGMDGFVWFTGVVEDRNDPSKLGRVKVRCLGLHTESKGELHIEEYEQKEKWRLGRDPDLRK